MRLSFAAPLAGVALVVAGCAQFRPAAPGQYETVNAWIAERGDVTLRFHDRAATPARDVVIRADSTSYFSLRQQRSLRVATASLHRVERLNRVRGAQLGVGAGALGAAAFVAAARLNPSSAGADADRSRTLTASVGSVASLVLGGFLGAQMGSPEGYTITPAR